MGFWVKLFVFLGQLYGSVSMSGTCFSPSKCRILSQDWIDSKSDVVLGALDLGEMGRSNHSASCFPSCGLISCQVSSRIQKARLIFIVLCTYGVGLTSSYLSRVECTQPQGRWIQFTEADNGQRMDQNGQPKMWWKGMKTLTSASFPAVWVVLLDFSPRNPPAQWLEILGCGWMSRLMVSMRLKYFCFCTVLSF